MRISEKRLRDCSNAYVENGYITKWRYGSEFEDSPLLDIDFKLRTQTKLTDKELEFIRSFDRVIIETNDTVEFIGFTGKTMKY